MPHVVLVGDSIFDNAAYTEGGPDVVSQVRALLPPGWEATLLAVDGAITDDVAGQLGRLPEQATRLVLSVGGNNALQRGGHSLPVIDLRSVCATREDYANPIEPSSVGGEKIARVIVGLICGARTTAPATRIVVA